MKIAIQGVAGAFHEIAARRFFGNTVEVVPAMSFQALFSMTEAGKSCEGAVAAIENNLAGSILGNYKLLQQSSLKIVGEVFLPIDQHLMALPGVEIAQLQEVRSHPMALAQCTDFFKKHPHIRLVESEDTAASARLVAEQRNQYTGAIAGELAAELYGLEIIAPKIQDNAFNYTRFLALLPNVKNGFDEPAPNKTSIAFNVPHRPGALAAVLNQMATDGANLTKIQSVPIEGKLWEYHFFLDFTFQDANQNILILNNLKKITTSLQVLGTYCESSL